MLCIWHLVNLHQISISFQPKASWLVDVASIGLMDKIKDTDSHFCNTQESFLPEEHFLVINKQRRVKGLLIKGFKIELMSNTRTPLYHHGSAFIRCCFHLIIMFFFFFNLFVLFLIHLWISLSHKVSSEFKCYYLSSESMWIEEIPPYYWFWRILLISSNTS